MSNLNHEFAGLGRNQALLAQSREAIVPPLVETFAVALGRFDDALFDRAERAGSSQTAFLDAMRELRRRREEIVGRYREHVEKAWASLERGEPMSIEVAVADPGNGLTLVSEQELESTLAARNLASVIFRECKPVLARLDRRLGLIAGNLVLDSEHNPVGADHVGVAVQEAFGACEMTLEVRLVLFKLCERDLVPGIARLYDALDEHLEKAGVIPEMVARPAKRAPPPPPPAELDQLDAVEEASAPAWAARFTHRMAGMKGGMQASLGQAANNASPADLPGGAQGVLLEALHHLLQESRGNRPGPRPDSQGSGDDRPLTPSEMLSVLSVLQSAPSASLRAAIGDSNESLAQRLKSEVLNSATKLGGDAAGARLAPVDEDAIDLVGMLFDVMLDERDLEGRPRELIGRLLVPFVKVALLDRRMFVQKTHPARRLLNVLAEACEGNSGESPSERTLMAKVEEVVDRLTAEFNENLAIFLTLEDEFRDFLGQHKRRIEIAERRATEIQRGQERLDAARTRMNAELSTRLDGRHVPQAINDFMRQPWAHHVTMTVLREGDDSEGLRDALALADGVLEELAEAQRQIIGKPWLQAWRPSLQKVFASVGMNADGASGAVDALHDTLQAVAASRPDLEKALPELPQVGVPKVEEENTPMQLVAGTDTLDFDRADADHFRALPIGTWLDFIDKDNRLQAGKLSWVSPISARLLFVSRRGVRFCVASPEELAVMVRLGRLRAHRQEDAFDSAMQGVIERLDPVRPVAVNA